MLGFHECQQKPGVLGRAPDLHYAWHSRLWEPLISHGFPSLPIPWRWHRWLRWMLHLRWIWTAAEEPHVYREFKFFLTGSKQTHVTFSPEGGEIIFHKLGKKQTWLLLWREALSPSSKAVCYPNIPVQITVIRASHGRPCRNLREPWRVTQRIILWECLAEK